MSAVILQTLVLSAIVPSLLLLWFFHARDVYPEPQRVVWATFGLGLLTTVLAVVIEVPLGVAYKAVANPFAGGALDAFACAAPVEEALKFAVVVGFCMRHKEFDEPMDGIVYGAIASLGFATLENVLYVAEGGLQLAAFRAVTAVPGHACMGAIMGYFVGQAKFAEARRGSLLAKAYVIPFLLHGFYDAPLLIVKRVVGERHHSQGEMGVAGLLALVTLAVLVVEIAITLVLSQKLRREQRAWATAHPARVSAAIAPARTSGGALGWFMVAVGVLFASAGAFMSLGTAILVAKQGHDGQALGPVLAAGAIFGALPLGIGVLLFALGVARVRVPAPARAVTAMG